MIHSPPLVIPSVNDIRFAPERATLVILQAALVIAARALAVEHPSVMAHDNPCKFDSIPLARARELLDQFNGLTDSIERYFAAVDDLARPHDATNDLSIF
jgi:hypothetical protein